MFSMSLGERTTTVQETLHILIQSVKDDNFLGDENNLLIKNNKQGLNVLNNGLHKQK